MIHRPAFLPLLIALSLSCCTKKDSEITADDFRKLDAVGDIAAEVQLKHGIECQPYWKIENDVGQIELHVPDAAFDHAALAAEIAKLESVRSSTRDIRLVFVIRGAPPDTNTLTTLAKYDAKTGKQIQP